MRATLPTVLALALTACSPHKVTRNPAPPIELAEGYKQSGSGGALPQQWWKEFSDADLDRLVARTLAGNLQLKSAWARLAQARAVGRQLGAGRYPQLEASLSGARQKIRSPFADAEGLPPGQLPETFTVNNFSASLAAGYEIDIWKRLSSRAAGAALDALAARDGAEALAMTLVAEVTDTWFELVAQRATRKLLARQVAVSETFLELVTLRFRQGLASSLDINQQRQQVIATRSQLPLIDASIDVLENRLAVLTGQVPGAPLGGQRDNLPNLPALPGKGIPADLLDRRPDVRAARRQAEAADHRVAAAVADRLPGLRLSASVGKQSGKLGEIFTTPTVWSLVGALVAPLFDGGRRKAEVDRNRFVVEERLANYGNTLLQAIAEVESATTRERQQLLYIADLGQQLEVSNRALDDARARYQGGLAAQGFLQVLTALQAQQQAELALLRARRQALAFRVQLFRALGGTWTQNLKPTRLADRAREK